MKYSSQDILRFYGLKVTPKRITILGVFEKSPSPLSAEDVFKKTRSSARAMDLATIYRTLRIFLKHRILKSIEFAEGKFRYELASLPHHHHAVCTNCQKIVDVPECDTDYIEATLRKSHSFQIAAHTLEFFGLCNSCQ